MVRGSRFVVQGLGLMVWAVLERASGSSTVDSLLVTQLHMPKMGRRKDLFQPSVLLCKS